MTREPDRFGKPQPDPPLWRIGNHYGIHVYCGEVPIATFHAVADAKAAVRAYNSLIDARPVVSTPIADLLRDIRKWMCGALKITRTELIARVDDYLASLPDLTGDEIWRRGFREGWACSRDDAASSHPAGFAEPPPDYPYIGTNAIPRATPAAPSLLPRVLAALETLLRDGGWDADTEAQARAVAAELRRYIAEMENPPPLSLRARVNYAEKRIAELERWIRDEPHGRVMLEQDALLRECEETLRGVDDACASQVLNCTVCGNADELADLDLRRPVTVLLAKLQARTTARTEGET